MSWTQGICTDRNDLPINIQTLIDKVELDSDGTLIFDAVIWDELDLIDGAIPLAKLTFIFDDTVAKEFVYKTFVKKEK